MPKKVYYWGIIASAFTVLLMRLLAETSLGESGAFAILAVLIPLFVIGVFLSIPYFYRKSLAKRTNRSLRGFILADPQFRDALISKPTAPSPDPKAPAAKPAAPKPEPQKPRPSPPRPPAKK